MYFNMVHILSKHPGNICVRIRKQQMAKYRNYWKYIHYSRQGELGEL